MEPLLIFNISNQEIERIDEFTVVESSVSYLKAQFNTLTDDWEGMIITGVFVMEDGTPIPSLADENGICKVPETWLVKQKGYVGAIGSDGVTKITTRAVKVSIREKGYTTEAMDEESQSYFDQIIQEFAATKEFVAQEADRAEAAEKSAEAWAHGHEDYPERAEDNAAYYAAQTKQDALRTYADRTAVIALAEHVDNASQTVDADMEKVEGLTAQAQSAAENALISEQNAKTSETAAQAARAGAEAAEGQAELFAGQAKEDKKTVETAKDLVLQMSQEVAESKQSIEQTAEAFNLTHQQAIADVNNAGQTQTERVQEAGEQAVGDINAAKTGALSEINSTGAAQKQAVEDTGAAHLKNVIDAGTAQTKSVNDAGTAQTAEVNAAGAAQLKTVNDAGAAQVSSITQEGAAQVANVQEAAADIIADRDQIELNRQNILKNIIKRTASGKTILVSDSAGTPFAGLKTFGRTEQGSTTGAQLWDSENAMDGYIGINGTVTAVADDIQKEHYNDYISVSGVTHITYDMQATVENNCLWLGIGCYDTDKTFLNRLTYQGLIGNGLLSASDGWDLPQGTEYIRISYRKYEDGVLSVRKGNVLIDEPYTGGIPSPNPDYTQEMVSAGDKGSIETLIYASNLVDYRNAVPNASGAIRYEGDRLYYKRDNHTSGIAVQGGATWVTYLVKGSVYIYSNPARVLKIYKGNVFEDGYNASDRIFNNSITNPVKFEIPENGFYTFGLWLDLAGEEIYVDSFSVSYTDNSGIGNYASPQSLTISTPNGLPGIPVSSVGNYTDENGQKWIADEIDFGRGVYVQRVGVSDLKNLTWINDWNENPSYYIEGTFLVYTNAFDDVVSTSIYRSINIRCTHFTRLKNNILKNSDTGMQAGQGKGFNVAFRVPTSIAANAIEWQQWISDNNVKFYYTLEVPIETPIPADELAAYHALHTNYPYTTVYNDEGCWMEMEYGVDNEEYVAEKAQESSIMTDETTGKKYILGMKDGLLTVYEVIE